MTATEALSRMYADRFIERFASISGHWEEPLVDPLRHPHQNIAGNAYRGCNRTFLPMIATARGYRLPLWMTVPQMQELSVWPLKGTSGVPVSFTDIRILEKESGRRSTVTPEEYDGMEPGERDRRGLQRVFHTKWYKVFNIEQTTFGEVWPEVLPQLERQMGGTDGRRIESDLLDAMVESDSWLCPIRQDPSLPAASYDLSSDRILLPPKSRFVDDRAYYGSLLRAMARSTGSELRLERPVWSDLRGDVAMEALVSELSASSMGALLGLGVTMDGGSERYLKTWIESVDASPQLIYDAVREAARATDCLGRALGLDMDRGIDIRSLTASAAAERSDREKSRSRERPQRTLPGGTVRVSTGQQSRRRP